MFALHQFISQPPLPGCIYSLRAASDCRIYNVCNILYPRRTHLRPAKSVCCVFDLSHTTSGRLRRMGCIPQRRKYVQFLYSGVPSSHVNRQ